MFGQSAPGPLQRGGLLGDVRAWLTRRSRDIWQHPGAPPQTGRWRPGHAPVATRVLVADDDPVSLMLISALMESRGVLPLLAGDGAEALALASELTFDLILMDLQMPVLDGVAATLAIRQMEQRLARPPVPVVAFSSLSPSDSFLAAHGLNGSLRKPCCGQELDACLARWCPSGAPAHAR